MELNTINKQVSWGVAADALNKNFEKVGTDLEKLKNVTTRNKGYFSSEAALNETFPTANVGDIAYVKVEGYDPFERWNWNGTQWVGSGISGGNDNVELGDYYTISETDEKFTETDTKLSELGQEVADSKMYNVPEKVVVITQIYTKIEPRNKLQVIRVSNPNGELIDIALANGTNKTSVTLWVVKKVSATIFCASVRFNGEPYLRVCKSNDDAVSGVTVEIYNSMQDMLEANIGNTAVNESRLMDIGSHIPYTETKLTGYTLNDGYLEKDKYNPSSSSTGKYTGFIPVTSGKTYRIVTTINRQYDCGVWFLKSQSFGYDSLVGRALIYEGEGNTVLNDTISIPYGCNYIVFTVRNTSNYNIYERTYKDCASQEKVLEIEGKLGDSPDIHDWAKQPYKPTYTAEEVNAVSRLQGSSNSGKVLFVGEDGRVVSGYKDFTPTEYNAVKEESTKRIYLKSNLLSNSTPVEKGSGWSGDFVNGFDVAQGTKDSSIVFDYETESGKLYLVSFDYNVAQEGGLYIQIGNEALVDVYNGQTGTRRIGIRSVGGKLRFYEANARESVHISNIKLQEVTDESQSTESVLLSVQNITTSHDPYSVDAYWNVSIGPNGTMSAIQNGTRNIAIGYQAEKSLKSGTRNVGIGTFALYNLESGERNVAIGSDALWQTKYAEDCVVIGKEAVGMMNNVDGEWIMGTMKSMTAVGQSAMGGNPINSEQSTAVGAYAGWRGTSHNTSVGYYANTELKGNYNSVFGWKSCTKKGVDGGRNTIIGAETECYGGALEGSQSVVIDNTVVIGCGAKAYNSNQVVIGNIESKEVILLGNKRIVFNEDKTVTWEEIAQQSFVVHQYTKLNGINGEYKLKLICESPVTVNVSLNTSANKSSKTLDVVVSQLLDVGEHIYNITFNGEQYLRVALTNDNIATGVRFEVFR